MQSVSAAWTAEENDLTRKIAESLLVSWKKQQIIGNRTFTIGVSAIGGSDVIGMNPGAVGAPGIYKYFDESAYIESLSWESEFPIPIGGMTKGLAEAILDNSSGRFTPRFMGGNSELFTSVFEPRKPMMISAGFNFDGVDQTIPQFMGVLNKAPRIDSRTKQVQLQAADYIDFFENRMLDNEAIFTSQRTDSIMQSLLLRSLGVSTAQYKLDTGLNTIGFAMFPAGTKFSDIFTKLTEAENGRFYQDERGVFRFENRQHWDSAPFTQVQAVIRTADVIEAESPNEDNIVNVVEVKSDIRTKLASQVIYQSQQVVSVDSSVDQDYFIQYNDPVLSVDTVTLVANAAADGSGSDVSGNVSIIHQDNFAQATKFTFHNTSGATAYITNIIVKGRPAPVTSNLYYRTKDGSSVTAYEERLVSIDNPFIQDSTWAQSLAQLILNQYSEAQNLQQITIRAKPRLQKGDLVSWQGHYYRIYGVKYRLDPSQGFVCDLKMFIATTVTYFRIGISTIGGGDLIAP